MSAKDDLPNQTRSPSIESTYHLKWVQWNRGRVPIVMQRINGPCPLIAIMNVLLFRERVKLPPMLEQITAHQLMTYLGECIMDSVPEEIQNNDDALLNLEQNIHDAIEILPKLQTGLDVNIKFSDISDFEYTPECIIFDLLRIPLYHGWLCDPSMTELHRVVGNLSYNQLVDSIITGKMSIEPEVVARVLIAEDFLEKTASQLTHYGLSQLKHQIKDNELSILFRNNHFVTLFKRDSGLYQLVTDHGFLTENIIWETLDNIEGDGKFVDSNFQIIDIKDRETNNVDKKLQQLENDYLMALSLKEEESGGNVAPESAEWYKTKYHEPEPFDVPFQKWIESDFELAKRLQDEEARLYQVLPNTTETVKPDVCAKNQIQLKEQYVSQQQHYAPQDPPPTPEPGPSWTNTKENISNIQSAEHQMVCNERVNNPGGNVYSQSKISTDKDPTLPAQSSFPELASAQKSSSKIDRLYSSLPETELAGSSKNPPLEGCHQNESAIEASGREMRDLEARQRRALHNQSILAATHVPTVDANARMNQQQTTGRPNSSKLPRAPLRSSDNSKSCALM